MTNFGQTKDELWKNFNNLKTETLVNYTRHSIMCKISSLATNIEEKKIIEKEINLTHLVSSIHHQITNFNIQHNEIENSILQFRLKCGNGIEFYKKRLDEAKNSSFKITLFFCLFCFRKKITHEKYV